MNLVTPQIAQLRPYEAGKPAEEVARELGIKDAIKLASNENPWGPSPKARTAIVEALDRLHRYPDAAQWELRQALAARLRCSAAEVILGNGSNELLELLIRTFCTAEHHLVFADPSFVVYRTAALAQGVPFTAVPLADHRHDLPAMGRAIRGDTRLVLIANPNNPTGTYVGVSELREFLAAVPPGVIVALDEAYIEYADAPDFPDGLALRDAHPRLVVLRTFSKIHGLATLRVGYAIAPTELIRHLDSVRAPFNVGGLAQAAALAALADQEHVERSRNANRQERQRLQVELSRLGLRVVPSQANFLLVELDRPGREVYEKLLHQGVIVRPIPPLPQAIRVTVGLPAENDRFLSALGEVL